MRDPDTCPHRWFVMHRAVQGPIVASVLVECANCRKRGIVVGLSHRESFECALAVRRYRWEHGDHRVMEYHDAESTRREAAS